MTAVRPSCLAIVELWNDAVGGFLAGRSAVPDHLRRWAAAYSGQGAGAVTLDAFPEPYLGDLDGTPAGVFLALNPGRADLEFQGRSGLFADEIRNLGSYSAWAATWPYLRDPWIARKGRNRHHAGRMAFLRNWVGDPDLPEQRMVGFELYPWHSTRVTAAMRPEPAAIEEYVLRPLEELRAPVFAFGAPWMTILEHGLGLPVIDRLGLGGRPYGSMVPSRSVVVFEHAACLIIAERHNGSAGPPSPPETALLRVALADVLYGR